MGIQPSSLSARIEWNEDHVDCWTGNAVAIGTSTTAVSAWSAKVTAARTAFDAKRIAYQAAEAATNAYYEAVADMTNAASAIIKQVKAQAQIVGGSVYTLAEIPPPATPSHREPPGTPVALQLELTPAGNLKLKWKCSNPAGLGGTVYQVARSNTATGPFIPLGGTGTKSFIDDTIPAGATQIVYQIQAVRSTAIGDAAVFLVNFGSNESGGAFATVTELPAAKLAA